MSLKSMLSIPVKLPARIEGFLPSGAPSVAGFMAKVNEQVPDVGASSTFALPKMANIVASVEEHIPHPAGMEIANLVQKVEFPVVAKVEQFMAGKEAPSAPPATQGLIALSFE